MSVLQMTLGSLASLLRPSPTIGAPALVALAAQHAHTVASVICSRSIGGPPARPSCWGHSFSTGSAAPGMEAPSFSEPAPSADLRSVFLGPPGVGKGTYASRIAKHLGVAHIATGDLIREEIKAQTNVGQQVTGGVSNLFTSVEQCLTSWLRR